MTRQKKTGCLMEGCTNHAAVKGLCNACYAFDRYWLKKSARARMRRVDQLHLYSTRMETVTPDVTHIRTRKKKVA
jgi:hypothetical protein